MFWLRILVLAGMCGAACSDRSVTAPSEQGRTYAGEWSGRTSQGTAIAFSVSAENVVTFLTIGYDFNGCRDTQTFSGLLAMIGESGLPGRVPTPSAPGFGFGSGSPEEPNFIQVLGQFASTQAAHGTVTFLDLKRCGNAVVHWNAAKR